MRGIACSAGIAALIGGALFGAAPATGDDGDGSKSPVGKDKRPAGVAPPADFNGDGYADHVITAPAGTVGGKPQAGYVAVVYGSANGTDTSHRQIISQAAEGVPGDPSEHLRWGSHAVARDLDGDGLTDLAVTPAHNQGVTVLWGTAGKGLSGGTELPEDVGGYRMPITGGDFNGDGKQDLVAVHGLVEPGDGSSLWELRILYGPFDRDAEPADTGAVHFPWSDEMSELTSGDMTGDGIDDLVTLHAFEEMSKKSRFWQGSSDGLRDEPTVLADHGATAVIGDVDKDGRGDLVMRTVPGGVVENLPYDHGTLKVIYGTPNGPGTRTTTLTQNSPGVPGTNEDGDQFGYALSAGDVNGDGYADIAAGVPGEDIGTGTAGRDTGAIVQLYGSPGVLSGNGSVAYNQSSPGIPGAMERDDAFGSAVSLVDTDADGFADLGIGTPGEDGTTLLDTGAAWVLRGAGGGLTTQGVVSFNPGDLGAPEAGARMGTEFAR